MIPRLAGIHPHSFGNQWRMAASDRCRLSRATSSSRPGPPRHVNRIAKSMPAGAHPREALESTFAGSTNWKVEPTPGLLSTVTWPP